MGAAIGNSVPCDVQGGFGDVDSMKQGDSIQFEKERRVGSCATAIVDD
jgi:hypothetical protein